MEIGQNVCSWYFIEKNLIWVTWGHKLSHVVKWKKYLVDTIEATFIAQLNRKLVRMFILMKA